MSLVSKLHKSRRHEYGPQGYLLRTTRRFASPMVDLVKALEQECFERQLTLSRWETSSRRNAWVKTITWAVHTGERPTYSRDVPEGSLVVVLDQAEGTTEKCIAYQKLKAMLERLTDERARDDDKNQGTDRTSHQAGS